MTNQEINVAVAKKLGWDLPDPDLWVRDYCGDIRAAWEVVEFLKKQEHTVTVELTANGIERDFYYDCWIQHAICKSVKADADTAPMAICLAFLKLP